MRRQPQKPTWRDEPVIVQPPVRQEEVEPEPEYVSVKLLNTDTYGGNLYVVIREDTREGRLVAKEHLKYTVKAQLLDKRIFEAGEKPYDWSSEIMSLAVTLEDIRIALWRNGLVSKKNVDTREIVAKLLQSGVLPIMEK